MNAHRRFGPRSAARAVASATRAAQPRYLAEPLEPRMLLAFGPAGAELAVNATNADPYSEPSVAADADGDFVVTWMSGYDIYARRFNAAGEPSSGEFRVNTSTNGWEFSPAVAMIPGGDFVVVWESRPDLHFGGSIYAQRYDATGQPLGGEFGVTSGQAHSPAVAADADGGFVVVCGVPLISGGLAWDTDVYARRYEPTGEPLGGEFRVNTTTTGHQDSPSVATFADGNFVVAWTSHNVYAGSDIFAQRYASAGQPLGGEFRVNTTIDQVQEYPAVAAGADGAFAIAWSGQGVGDDNGVFAQRYGAAGAPLGNEFRVDTTTGLNQFMPSVAVDGDGDFLVAWTGYNQDSSRYGVNARRYGNAGQPLGREFCVSTSTVGTLRRPAVAANADGDVVVTWGGGSGPDFGVYAQRFSTFSNPASVGNFLWIDANANGVQDAGEPGQDSYRVDLFKEFGLLISSTIASNGGFYRFDGLRPGDAYYLQHFPPTHFWFTDADQGADDSVDSDVDPQTGRTALFTLGADEVDLSRDAGVVPPATIAGAMFNDLDHDGVRDAGEGGLPYWRIYLDDDADGQLNQGERSALTADDGSYRFDGLRPGTHRVATVEPDHWAQTAPASGYHTVNLDVGQLANGIDFGAYFVLGSIAGVKFNDRDRDGRRDANEEGLPGWTIFLDADADGRFDPAETSTATDATGNYRFGSLQPGTYRIAEIAQPGWMRTTPAKGFYTVSLSVGQDAANLDFAANPGLAGPEFRVNRTTTAATADQQPPAVAVDADGDFVVAWESFNEDASGWDVYARRYDARGKPRGAEFRVNVTAVGYQGDPAVAMDDAGNIIITWDAAGPAGAGVYARRYHHDGRPDGGEFQVDAAARNPSVAADADGDFVVAWEGGGVYARRYLRTGAPAGGKTVVSADVSANNPAVGMDDRGDFVVVWQPEWYGGGILARRYDAAARTLGSEWVVGAYYGRSPAVAVDASGDFVVAWNTDMLFGSNDDDYRGPSRDANVRARRYTAAGVLATDEIDIAHVYDAYPAGPAVAMDRAGNFVVAWEDLSLLYDEQTEWNIQAQKFSAAGWQLGSPFRVNSATAGDQFRPAIAMDDAGDFVVAWQSSPQDGSGFGIYAQRFAAIPAPPVRSQRPTVHAGTLIDHLRRLLDHLGGPRDLLAGVHR